MVSNGLALNEECGTAQAIAHAIEAEPSSLHHYLQPLRELLDAPGVTEVCINRPGSAFVEGADGWIEAQRPFITYQWCRSLANLVANYTSQRVSATEPLLSATLPSGERIQIVLPPATEEGAVAITIRRPSVELWSIDQLARMRVFEPTVVVPRVRAVDTLVASEYTDVEQELGDLLSARNLMSFMRRAVQLRQNILLSGATGSGKTTISKALILEIDPEDRILTIEDVRELSLRNQPNHVRLFYSQGAQGAAAVTAGDLLAAVKRSRPDRVFVSELRTGEEVYDYLVSVNSGHPGSITSVHANTAEMAFVALAQLIKRSGSGRDMKTTEAVHLAQMNIDVVVQCNRLKNHRFVSEIWYDPSTKRRGLV